MNTNMWIDCNILSVFVRTLHNLGLLQCIAIYLYHEKHIAYTDFYEHIICYAGKNPETIIGQIYIWLKQKYTEVSESSGSLTCVIPEYGNLIWPLEEGAFLRIVLHFDRFFSEIQPVIKPLFEDEQLFRELLAYQKAVVKNPYHNKTVLHLHYDFFAYFKEIYRNCYQSLSMHDVTICLDSSDVSADLQTFAKETIWYGRKGGKNIVSEVLYLSS